MTAPTTRADGIDFAVIFTSAITDDWPCDVDAVEPHAEIRVLASPGEIAESVLAAKVPELCENCGGNISCPTHCGHPNAPTIGQMLREWQALTALAEYAEHGHACGRHRVAGCTCACTCNLNAARAALWAVRS